MAKKKAAKTNRATQQGPNKVNVVPGNELPTYYVNHVNVDLSSYDVRLRLGQIQGGRPGEVDVKEIAYVFMSPQHFVAFANAVNQMVERLKSAVEASAKEVTH